MTDIFDQPVSAPRAPSRAALRAQRAAHRRRKRRQLNSVIVVLSLLVLTGVGYVVIRNFSDFFGFSAPFEVEDYPGPGTGVVEVTIPASATGAEMATILKDAGVVKSTAAFIQAFKTNAGAQGIQDGTYSLKREMKADDAVAALVAGVVVDGSTLTIPEGWTTAQIVERAASVTGIPLSDFEATLAEPSSFGLPVEAAGNSEGWLFPAKYVLSPDETPVSLLTKMVQRTVVELDALGVPVEQRQAVLTKASLVERESAQAADSPKVARVIENRLAKNMTLGIDAAVAYGLGRSGTTLTKEDIKNPDNPYNTYVHPGVPPTPIASPGLTSLKAVLNPEPGDWLFWVTVNLETGETKFSTDYAEHQRYVDELRAWQREHPEYGS